MILPRGVILLGIVAVISIALNLFLAGTILGRQFHRPAPGHEFDGRLTAILREMPEADRKLAGDILQRHRDVLLERWRAARAAGQQAAVSLRATPFDRNEAQASLVKWNERFLQFRTAFQDTIVDVASQISPDGRARMRLGPGR